MGGGGTRKEKYMNTGFKNTEEKISRLLVLIAVSLLATFWIGMCSANAQQQVRTDEIRAKLCSKPLCLSRWDNVTILLCQPRPTYPVDPGTDIVFGSFAQGSSSCWCPCNFAKFYN